MPPLPIMFKHDLSSSSDFGFSLDSSAALPLQSGAGASLSAAVRGAPRLTGANPTDDFPAAGANDVTVSLFFNEPIQRGAGFIYVTDGVAQTVIGRDGKPAMRIVGATDTHAIAVSDTSKVTIINGTALVKVGDLLPGTAYSVLADKGVFRDLDGKDFAGIADNATLNFSTVSDADNEPPVLTSVLIGPFDVSSDLVLSFSESVYWDDASTILVKDHHGETIAEIGREQVSFSEDHLSMTIDAAVHQLSAGQLFLLTLPPSVVDGGANQLLFDTVVVDTRTNGGISTIAIVDDGADTGDLVTGVREQTISGTYTGELEEGDYIQLIVNDELIAPSSVEVNTQDHTWYWHGMVEEGSNHVTAFITDGENDHAYGWHALSFEVDRTAPQLPDGDEYAGVDPLDALELAFDEAIFWTDDTRLVLSDGDTSRDLGAADVTIDGNLLIIDAAAHGMAVDRNYTLTLPAGLKDQFGNGIGDRAVQISTWPDDTPPEALAAYVTTSNRVKKIGDTVSIVVHFSESVRVDESAELQIGTDYFATYDHHVGADVTFVYTVQPGDAFDNVALFSHEGLAGRVRDLAGNALDASGIQFNVLQRDGEGTVSIDVDGIAPDQLSMPVLAPGSDTGRSSSDNVTGDRTPTFTGTGAVANALVLLRRDGVTIASDRADDEGHWSITAPTQASGEADYTVVQQDDAGNLSEDSDPLVVKIDARGPSKVGNVNAASVLTLIFDEPISFGTGAIQVYDSGNHLVHTIRASDTTEWSLDEAGNTLRLEAYFGNGDYTVRFTEDTLVDEFGNALTELVGSEHGIPWTVYAV